MGNRSIICVIWGLKGREREKDAGAIYEETIAKNFPKMMKDFKLQYKKHHKSQGR